MVTEAEVLSELNSLIEMLESRLPANADGPENKKLATKLESDMVLYFRDLEQAIDFVSLERIYSKYAGARSLKEGGEGSGNFGHAGRPGEVGGSGSGGGSAISSERAERARKSYNPASREKQRTGEANEGKLAKAIGGKQNGDNEAFDVETPRSMVEVKTIVSGKNDKITMHPDSRMRKLKTAESKGKAAHTVVFDERSGAIYHKEGIGSFRLTTMNQVSDLATLRSIL